MADKQTWKEPATAPIKLVSGEIIEHEINGITPDGKRGFVFVNGEEIKVVRFNGEWSEDPFLDVDDELL